MKTVAERESEKAFILWCEHCPPPDMSKLDLLDTLILIRGLKKQAEKKLTGALKGKRAKMAQAAFIARMVDAAEARLQHV